MDNEYCIGLVTILSFLWTLYALSAGFSFPVLVIGLILVTIIPVIYSNDWNIYKVQE